jgi:tetratricopeptide (TPR) repeat protein
VPQAVAFRRTTLVVAVLTSCFAAVPAGAQDHVRAMIREGDELFKHRTSEKVAWEAIGFFQEVLKADSRSYEARWRLARSYVDLGERATNRSRQRELGKTAMDHAQEAVKASPAGVEGWYYSAAGIGIYALGVGILTALREGVEGKFRGALDKAITINPDYDYAGPIMTLGRYYSELPWPKRDLKKSIALLEDARRRAPRRIRTVFYLAESYLADGRKAEGLETLRACAAMDPKREDPIDGRLALGWCAKLLAKVQP